MKLRQLPEDFIVEEINEFKVSSNGNYKIYILEKKGIEAFYAFRYLAKQNNIPQDKFGVAGLKDKHAITRQFFTIPSEYSIKESSMKEKNFSIKFIGFINQQLKPGDSLGNRFEITVRDIAKGEIPPLDKKAIQLKNHGIPNYFDSQRFGSAIGSEFAARYILIGNYETAVKLFLTKYTKSEKKSIKDEKRAIAESWPDFSELRLRTKTLNDVITEYNKTKSWLKSYSKIPYNIQQISFRSYQSFLWNETLKAILNKVIKKDRLFDVKYNAGILILYKEIYHEEQRNIPKTIQLASKDMIITSDSEKAAFEKIMQKQGFTANGLKSEIISRFFTSGERESMIQVKDFQISKPLHDELNKNRFKFVLKFSLSKGSYATLVTKRIFGK